MGVNGDHCRVRKRARLLALGAAIALLGPVPYAPTWRWASFERLSETEFVRPGFFVVPELRDIKYRWIWQVEPPVPGPPDALEWSMAEYATGDAVCWPLVLATQFVALAAVCALLFWLAQARRRASLNREGD